MSAVSETADNQDQNKTTAENIAQLTALAEGKRQHLKTNTAIMQQLAVSVPYGERMRIFNAKKTETTVPIAVNIFLPFLLGVTNVGAGSFMQGDTAGGLIHLGTGLTGTGLLVGGFCNFLLSDLKRGSVKISDTSQSLLITGTAFAVGSWLFGIIRPAYYASSRNKLLGDALLINDKAKVTFNPIFGPQMQLGIKVAVYY